MKMVEEGNYVKEGQGLFMISNLATVWANFDAYEKQLSSIKKGDVLIITSNANPTTEIKAKVSFIDPVLNTSTRTVIVRAELNNSKGALKPGMFVKGILTSTAFGSAEKTQITIPKTAVLWTGKRSVVYVKKQGTEPVFEMRIVTIGNEINDAYEILEGLNENEEIVTNGTFTVDAAAQLQGKKSMMNKTGGKVMTGHENHSGTQEKDGQQQEPHKLERIQVSSKFQKQLNDVFTNYLSVKDALVNDDNSLAQKSAYNLNEILKKVDMKLLTDNKSHNLWMNFLKEINNSSKEISTVTDIEIQREHFINLSNNISKSIEVFGINKKVYKQFCPMADNDIGAIWLSTSAKIMNPYFGASMLHCGNVEAIIV
jgi:Cu(I)/Ag(I) efflux system membrane fusion protein